MRVPKWAFRRRTIVLVAVLLLVGLAIGGFLFIGREELRFVQLQQLTQRGRPINEWHASFQRFAQQPILVGPGRFGFRRGGGGEWVIEELREGQWVDRPLANAQFRYYSDPTIRVPNDLTNAWRLRVTSQRDLVVGYGTNEWVLSRVRHTLRSEALPPLKVLQAQSTNMAGGADPKH